MNIGLIGDNVGPVLGMALFVICAYFSYRRAKSSRERRFAILSSIALFVFVCSFLAVLFLFDITHPMIFVPFVFLLFAVGGYLNRQRSRIEREEQTR